MAPRLTSIPTNGIYTAHGGFSESGGTPCAILSARRDAQTFERSALFDIVLTVQLRASVGEMGREEFGRSWRSLFTEVRCLSADDLTFGYAVTEGLSFPGETRRGIDDGVRFAETDLMVYGYRRPDAGAEEPAPLVPAYLLIDDAGHYLLIGSNGNKMKINAAANPDPDPYFVSIDNAGNSLLIDSAGNKLQNQ